MFNLQCNDIYETLMHMTYFTILLLEENCIYNTYIYCHVLFIIALKNS